MHLSVMVSSTIYTNHSSSFSTAKIIWRNRICIGFSFYGWLFKYWPFDYHDSGAFRTGLGEATRKLESKQWLIQIGSHPDVDALDVTQVEKQDVYDLVLWQQILLKEFMLNQKVVFYSWLMIKTFLCQFLSGCPVFSKTCHVFRELSCIRVF